jgi:hypothetical protein
MNGISARPLPPEIDKIQRISLVTGAAALAICFAAGSRRSDQFFHSYLTGYIFWTGMALGCFGLLMLHHLAGGGWGFIIRRPLESGVATLPLMLFLFVPLLFGLRRLYSWAQPEAVARDVHLQATHVYLNVPFFLGRMGIYFAFWLTFGLLLDKWSVRQDQTADTSILRRMQFLSGPGLVVYVGSLTFASIDWVMSMEAHWYSTIYGLIYVAGETLSGLALVIAVATLLRNEPALSQIITPGRFRDLGNLLLTFVMLWAYMQFSQFLIIWAENLTGEIPWYLHRLRGGWQWIAAALIAFHFFVPFFLLLLRDVKDHARNLGILAAAMLAMRWLDHVWLVEPALHPGAFHLDWMDAGASIGIGGLWIAVFIRRLKSAALAPLHDPRMPRTETERA